MQIFTRSRHNIENGHLPGPCVLISISDPGSRPVMIKDIVNVKALLRLEFHDIEEPMPGYVPFDRLHIDALRAMIEISGIWDYNTLPIIVQCEAGVSRSAAIAIWLSREFHEDDKLFWMPPCQPNRWMLEMLGVN